MSDETDHIFDHQCDGLTPERLARSAVPTPYGQKVLDELCRVVARHRHFGYLGFSIGDTPDITRYLARRLGRSVRSVAGALGHLAKQGLIHTSGFEPDFPLSDTAHLLRSRGGQVGLAPASWYRCSWWSEDKLVESEIFYHTGDRSLLEVWLLWDGIDCTAIGHGAPAPFAVELSLARSPSRPRAGAIDHRWEAEDRPPFPDTLSLGLEGSRLRMDHPQFAIRDTTPP
jgi:hypothetical protein